MTSRSADRTTRGLGSAIENGATVLDARFASLELLRSLLPDLIVAVDIQIVRALTSLAESTIYSKLDESHHAFDPDFPRPAKLGQRSVWNLSAVQDYLRLKFEEADGPAASRMSQRVAKTRTAGASRKSGSTRSFDARDL